MEGPKWETVGPKVPDLVARQTAAFADRVLTPDATQPVPDPAVDPFADSSIKGRRGRPAVVDSLQAARDAQRDATHKNPPSDIPQLNVPVSADFENQPANPDALGDKLRRRAARNPRDIADQLDIQLYEMLCDEPAAELASFSSLVGDDRELVAALIDGFSNFRSNIRENGYLLQARKIQPLLDLADRLRSQAMLTIPAMVLCDRVDGYGKYNPIPARFPAGRDTAAIVYCEVANFRAKQNAEQMWETKLSEQVTLYTEQGLLVWSDVKRDVTDECRNRRHDLFAYTIITLPRKLTPGQYTLHLSIVDENEMPTRVAESEMAVVVGER